MDVRDVEAVSDIRDDGRMIIKCQDNGMVQGTREFSETRHGVAVDEI